MAIKSGLWIGNDERAFLKAKKLKEGYNIENVNQAVSRTVRTIHRNKFISEEKKVIEKEEKIPEKFKEAFSELKSKANNKPKRFETSYWRNNENIR